MNIYHIYLFTLIIQLVTAVISKKNFRAISYINLFAVITTIVGFYTNNLEFISSLLITYTAILLNIIINFSRSYFFYSENQKNIFKYISLIQIAVFFMILGNNIIFLGAGSAIISFALYKLINFESNTNNTQSIKNYFILADCLLITSLFTMGLQSNSIYIADILTTQVSTFALFLLVISLFIKSGIFPFHKWLIDSIKAPTPVSALMHAGIINLGAYIVYLFYPLIFSNTSLQFIIIITALISSIFGQIFIINQIDIKRKLIYSTCGQLGYMYLQIAIGFVSGAIYHLITHGLLKSNLFLSQAELYDSEFPINTNTLLSDAILIFLSFLIGLIIHIELPINILAAFFIAFSGLNLIYDMKSLIGIIVTIFITALYLFLIHYLSTNINLQRIDININFQYAIITLYSVFYLSSRKISEWLSVNTPILKVRYHYAK